MRLRSSHRPPPQPRPHPLRRRRRCPGRPPETTLTATAAVLPAAAFALAADHARAALLSLMDDKVDDLDEFIRITVAAPSVQAVTVYSLTKRTGKAQQTVRNRVDALE